MVVMLPSFSLKLDERWLPKSVLCLRDYNLNKFSRDLVAGVTVGLVALPLAMAFSIASGLTPQAGIYCAVVTGFLISLLGGSKTQIGGPTGAFVVVVAGIVAAHGVEGLFMCTVMAGVLLIILGATGMGSAVKFIPRPVVIGFTNGIAVLIASTQVKDFFGLHLAKVPGEFWLRLKALATAFGTWSPEATLLAVGTVVVIVICRVISPRLPGPIVSMLGATVVAFLLKLPVETIFTRFGGIPSGLPHIIVPRWHAGLVHGLLGPAFTVALLGAIESLMSAVVADRMSNGRHKPNVELMAQGIANFFSPMFGGLPATGAIARTATSIRSGAQTPVAGMIHALTLLCVLLFAAPLAGYVPMAALAGILMVVAYNMGEWREIPQLLKMTKTDISVWLVTFALTVFADLTVAVEAGMILAALLFIARVSNTTTVAQVTDEYVEDGRMHILQDKDIPQYTTIFRIHGPFLSVRRRRLLQSQRTSMTCRRS
jgi:sulfate permease, SulP family